jgi:hypothetical protein
MGRQGLQPAPPGLFHLIPAESPSEAVLLYTWVPVNDDGDVVAGPLSQ